MSPRVCDTYIAHNKKQDPQSSLRPIFQYPPTPSILPSPETPQAICTRRRNNLRQQQYFKNDTSTAAVLLGGDPLSSAFETTFRTPEKTCAKHAFRLTLQLNTSMHVEILRVLLGDMSIGVCCTYVAFRAQVMVTVNVWKMNADWKTRRRQPKGGAEQVPHVFQQAISNFPRNSSSKADLC